MTLPCRLCNKPTIPFQAIKDRHYFRCPTCQAIQLHPDNYPTPEQEKERYENHENDVHDQGYQQSVAPIVTSILKNQTSKQQGLDFGSGPGPIVTTMLQEHSYNIRTYDPFFHNDESALKQTYDYIACCEVIEHFHHPAKEFHLLRSLLKPGGKLYCKTDIYTDDIDFSSWYYKNDTTHVFFYHPDTFEWIQKNYAFKTLQINDRLIILS